MNIDTLYEWEVIVQGKCLGKTSTEKRHDLIKQAIAAGIIHMPEPGDIRFNLVKKHNTPGPESGSTLG